MPSSKWTATGTILRPAWDRAKWNGGAATAVLGFNCPPRIHPSAKGAAEPEYNVWTGGFARQWQNGAGRDPGGRLAFHKGFGKGLSQPACRKVQQRIPFALPLVIGRTPTLAS
jgi:hypothetical protein